MSILTKIMLGLVLIATFPTIYFAAGVLNLQGAWRTKVTEFEAARDKEQKLGAKLEYGSDEAQRLPYVPGKPLKPEQVLGVAQLETARNNLMLSTGRVWYATRVTESVNPETNSLKMMVYDTDVDNVQFGVAADSGGRKEQADHGFTDKTILYIFQMAHNGTRAPEDRYVGEFVISGLIETNIPLKPARPLTPAQWDALRQGSSQWVVYDKMPLDSRDLFVGYTDEEIQQRVPAAVAAEYINDNQKPTEAVLNDEHLKQYVEEDKASKTKRFLRPLRDYDQIFRTGAVSLADMVDKLQILKKEKEYADRGKENAEKILTALDARKVKLEAEKAVVEAELAVIKEHSEKLTAAVEQMKQELSRLLADHKRRNEPPAAGGKTAAVPSPAAGASLRSN
ncbi:MAG: hypothetical protein K8U03_01710 [Planctomycetia bacterium]|nr:hypothetical protein [Planctomycetia bacterium]